jgi:T5SS/PEP-CTERM-associated repeat protein
VGHGSGSTGVALVDGTNSTWTLSDQLQVGGGASGRLTVGAGGTVHATNAINVNTMGTVDLTGGAISAAGITLAGGTLIGEGTATGVLSNAGRVAPGHSAGTLSIVGAYAQAAAGTLEIELGGATPGTGFDQVTVAGGAAVGGTLHVSLIGNFHPALGQTFTILTASSVTGAFASVVTTPPSLGVQVIYNAQSVVLIVTQAPPLIGDLNCDGLINNGDIDPFVLALTNSAAYAAQFPGCNLHNADINGDGLVNNGDIDAFVALLTGG